MKNSSQHINYDEALEFAKLLALDARKITMKYYRTNLQYITKNDTSPVTVADQQINQLAIDRVKERFPNHGILGEEQSWQPDREILWVCDPIDGTIAFSMGEPIFMFSIALVKNGIPIVAVAGDLASGGIFWATKGGGAYLNDSSIHVSSRSMNEAWLAFPANLRRLYGNQPMYQRIAKEAYQAHVVHGSVNKGVLLAQGLSDGTIWLGSCHPWDVAAVKLIVEEAGGKFTDLSGGEQRFDDELVDGAIMSNGIIHDDIVDIIKNKQ